jgi:Tfp pilus assembly protein PilO
MSLQRVWVFASIALAAVILLLGWFLAISPLLSAAGEANSQRVQVAAENKAHEAKIAELKIQFQDIDTLRAELADMQLGLPPTEATDSLLDQLAAKAVTNAVTIAEVNVTGAVSFLPREGLSATLVDETNFLTMPVSVTAAGSYEAVMAFIEDIQSGPRLFVPDTLSWAATTAGGGTTDGQTDGAAATSITVSISGLTYVLLDPAHPVGAGMAVCGTEEAAATAAAPTTPVECLPPFPPRTSDPFTPLPTAG